MTPPDHERGSAVAEALIAALIVAAMVGVSFTTIREGVARTRGLDLRARAMLVAQSQLAGVGALVPVAPGTTRGGDGQFAWSIEVDSSDVLTASDLNIVTVQVTPANGGAPLAVLKTLRLAG